MLDNGQINFEILNNGVVVDGLNSSILTEQYFEKLWASGISAINFTVGRFDHSLSSCIRHIAEIYSIVNSINRATICRTSDDIKNAKKNQRVGVILGFQDISPLEGDLNLLPIYRQLGVKIVQPTYNFHSLAGDGVKEVVDRGITDFGKEMVSFLNHLGLLIDLSHVGNQTILGVVESTNQPVACTHSNCYELAPVDQNKPDHIIKAIADTGGFIGVTAFPRLLQGNPPTLSHLLDHIDYIVKLVGIDHVAWSSDFNEGWLEVEWRRQLLIEIDGEILEFPVGFQSCVDLPKMINLLFQRGYSKSDVEKIMGGNFLRVLNQVEAAGSAYK